MKKKIAVLGGGNGAHALAAEMSFKGHTVHLFEMEQFRKSMTVVFEEQKIEVVGDVFNGIAHLDMVTSNIEEAIQGAEIIFVCVPAFAQRNYAKLLAPFVNEDQVVVLLPGSLGTLEFAKIWSEMEVKSKPTLVESNTLPYATRLEQQGVVRIFKRITVKVGIFPSTKSDKIVNFLNEVIDVEPMENVLNVAFRNMNPIIHTPGVILNAGRIERSRGEFYFYEEGMTQAVIRVMEKLEEERIQVAKLLGINVVTVAEALSSSGYGPRGTTWETINGSATLTPIKGPNSMNTRFLTEDIPYGLVTYSSIAKEIGMDTPLIDSIINMGTALLPFDLEEGRTVDKLGLKGLTIEEIINYTKTGIKD